MDAYETRELNTVYKKLQSRQTLGAYWKDDINVDVQTCIERIDWLLNGSYGFGEMLHARNLINNNIRDKKGKNLVKAYSAAGRELTMLVAIYDTADISFRKLSEVWKQKGIDFAACNLLAANEIKQILGD